jgi:hypothetical protein
MIETDRAVDEALLLDEHWVDARTSPPPGIPLEIQLRSRERMFVRMRERVSPRIWSETILWRKC